MERTFYQAYVGLPRTRVVRLTGQVGRLSTARQRSDELTSSARQYAESVIGGIEFGEMKRDIELGQALGQNAAN